MTTNPKLKVAILDDYQQLALPYFSSVSPDGLEITSFSDTLHPKHSEADHAALVDRLKPFQVVSSMRERTPFPASILKALPNLKLLLTTGKRNLAIDLQAASEQGIVVAGTDAKHNLAPSKFNRLRPDSTTTHCWAMILGLARHIARDDRIVKDGGWQGDTLATALPGKTLALLGLGRLGTAVGRIAVLGFGMRVICWSSSLTQEKADEQARGVGLDAGEFEVVSKEELFKEADVLSVHYVLSDRSRGIVGKSDLALLKPEAFVVNTSRGPLVDDDALYDVLAQGKIAGAALDVFDQEPLPSESRWRTTQWGKGGRAEVLLTPHMGYGETETLKDWYKENSENLGRWLRGEQLTARLN
jgi:lactate dehydrogenase-like 2-hydroxyacid dehydrogenase